MQDLIQEYKNSLEIVKKLIEDLEAKQTTIYDYSEDIRLLKSMERDLRWSLEWMRTARRPGNRRGVERLAVYQREKPFDPILIQQYFHSLDRVERASISFDPFNMMEDKHSRISETDKERIDAALSILSPLEREVYLMSRGKCISFKNIGLMLGIKESTVACKIERAEKKIAKLRENTISSIS